MRKCDLPGADPASSERTMSLLLLATQDSDLPASEAVMDLIFAAASLMLAVHTSKQKGNLCPPMTKNKTYNAAAQAIADLAAQMGIEQAKPA